MTVFGPIVIASDVEAALIATLRRWLPTYLGEMERLTSRAAGSLPLVKSYSQSNRFDRRPQDQLPAAIVVSPGLADRPRVEGDGTVGAWWRLGLAVVCSANTREATNELAKLYGAAVRTLLLQRPDLDGAATELALVSETYDDVPADYLEIGASVQIECDVYVDAISNTQAGPAQPAVDPGVSPTPRPPVAEANVDIELRSLT